MGKGGSFGYVDKEKFAALSSEGVGGRDARTLDNVCNNRISCYTFGG